MRPLLDNTSEFDIKMFEGDPISFNWIVQDVDWIGAYEWACDAAGTVVSISATATAVADDTTFQVLGAEEPALTPTTSGHRWTLKKVDGTTRFAGLLFVEEKIA